MIYAPGMRIWSGTVRALLVSAVILVGSAAVFEIAYRIALATAGTLPVPPKLRLPATVRSVAWASVEVRGPLKMVPVWPWSLVAALWSRELPAGWRLASVDGRRIVSDNAQARPKPALKWVLSATAVAIWITRHWTTEEAVNYFWQTAAFPRNIRGLVDATSYFMGRPADSLSVSQAALLGGLTIEPNSADPYCNGPIADELRRRVMTNLQRAALISPQEARDAISVPIPAMLIPRNDCSLGNGKRP